MAGADNFGIEQGKAGNAVEWMNSYAKKNNERFEARLAGYSMRTIKFGSFEVITWSGDWSSARNAIKKVSSKLGAKVVESGYHEKRSLLSAMFGGSTEYAKVFSRGKLVGRIELKMKAGRWVVKSESFV
ncbi:MAG: hypothetical protein ACREBU_17235 [Nitrososphaera sp.]